MLTCSVIHQTACDSKSNHLLPHQLHSWFGICLGGCSKHIITQEVTTKTYCYNYITQLMQPYDPCPLKWQIKCAQGVIQVYTTSESCRMASS